MANVLTEVPIGTAGALGAFRPGVAREVTPLLITEPEVTLVATADEHRVYAVALAAPALSVDVLLPASPPDGAIVTVKGDGATLTTVASENGADVDAGGTVSVSFAGLLPAQARTFVYFAALGAWRIVWAFGSGGLPPPPLP